MRQRVIAIDFDGTLFENAFPDIGAPRWEVINQAIAARQAGYAVVLWTCREGERLQAAIDACTRCGLAFDAINALPPELEFYEKEGTPPYRKVFADFYIDDRARSPEEFITFQL